MSVTRVWPNGIGSMPTNARGPYLSASDVAKLDANLQRVADKSWVAGGQSVAGPITLGAGGVVGLDSSTSNWTASGSGHDFSTATGGRIRCLGGQVPKFSAARSSSPYVSFTEFAWSGVSTGYPFPNGVIPVGKWYTDPSTLWLQPGTQASGVANAALVVPLSRAHDGKIVTSLSVYFAVHASRVNLPTRYPGFSVLRVDPFLGTVTTICDWTYFTAPANITAYKNGATAGQNGTPNVITATFSETINDAACCYVLLVLDEDYDAGADTAVPNEFVALSMSGTSTGLQFQ